MNNHLLYVYYFNIVDNKKKTSLSPKNTKTKITLAL